MNKDLDERLVPNGEYRNAENIEISTSEDSDVGAVQNVVGNTKLVGKTYDASTQVLSATGWDDVSNAIDDLTNPTCIGSVKDTQNNKIYWFIATSDQSVSAIAEYEESTGVISPILVDKNSILNFSSSYLITGINVIEGMLLWTDNQTEPKKINIKYFKSGSKDFNTHTKFKTGLMSTANRDAYISAGTYDFTENDITTIKLSPLQAPSLTMSSSKRTGIGTGTSQPALSSYNFRDANDVKNEVGDEITLTFANGDPDYRGPNDTDGPDRLSLKHKDSADIEFEVVVKITSLENYTVSGSTYKVTKIKAKIESIPEILPSYSATPPEWEVRLKEDDALFENKFPRYAYRWKYNDGEYSCYSPFSEPAFLPANFQYETSTGFNEALINNVRLLTVTINETTPDDVDEIDILYKESNSNLVYVAETLKRDANNNIASSYGVKSEIIGKVVEANQLLRPWDNVPKKSQTQEVTANRLIYGNYYQNYNILKENLPDISTSILKGRYLSATQPDGSTSVSAIKQPAKSLKSQRTYQVGVVYKDVYGRETPVFSNSTAAKLIGKEYSATSNSLEVKLNNDPPSWATHYKYFIKETSNEYYNVALDRFYAAEDGNIWLSFPSCERNKIKDDTYLLLKKKHNSDEAVTDTSKYRVIDVSNEPPEFLTINTVTVATHRCRIKSDASDKPGVGVKIFEFRGPMPEFADRFARGFNADASLRIITDAGKTRKYKVANGGPTGEFNGTKDPKEIYRVELERSFTNDEEDILSSTYIAADKEIKIELFEDKKVNKPEFWGKFFVKIQRDDQLQKNIITSFPGLATDYVTIDTEPIRAECESAFKNAKSSFDGKTQLRYVSGAGWKDMAEGRAGNDEFKKTSSIHPEKGALEFSFYWAGIDYGDDWQSEQNTASSCELFPNLSRAKRKLKGCESQNGKNDHGGRAHNKSDVVNKFLDTMSTKGTVFSFTNVAGTEGALYKTTDTATIFYDFRCADQPVRREMVSKRRKYTIKFEQLKKPGEGFTDDFDKDTASGTNSRIQQINIKQEDIIAGEDVISSSNPAIFETEPKESVDLDLYNEISDAYPIIKPGMKITGSGIQANTTIASVTDVNNFTLSQNSNAAKTNETLTLTDANGVYSFTVVATFGNSSTSISISDGNYHGHTQTLDWFNCYTFGNGVESNRLRDDFNALFVDKGPKVSTVMAEQYKEEHKLNGLIWSGIFNSTSSINRLNQFIMADPITKDLNPYYGSIQRLHGRRSDLLAFCEDQVLKILANKDALYEAGGKPQVTATNQVLGQSIPYAGEYGISKNPESFVSHANNVFWADKARGAVCTLNQNGVFPISSQGMTDWFKDNLPNANSIIGTYNQNKNAYNITLDGSSDYTLSYDPNVQGWTSFKSFIPESGLSMNNKYYTFKDGEMWLHNNTTRNNFYGVQYQSGITVLLNDSPELIKGFKTLNYEGTEARKYTYAGTISSTAIGNQTMEELVADGYTAAQINGLTETVGKGWYCNDIKTNEADGAIRDFKEKEGKWFNYLKGDTTTLSNIDSEEFSVQGIGQFASISGDTSITGYDVIITLAAETGLTLASVASASGAQSWSQNGNVITLYNVANGTNLNSFNNLLLTFTADTGYTLPSSQSITSQSPTSFEAVDAGDSDWNSSTGVLTLDFTSQTISSADKAISLNLANGGTAKTYTVNGTYDTVEANTTTASTVSTAYNGTAVSGAASTVITKTFTAATNNYFEDLPTCQIITEDSNPDTFYTISTSDTTTTMNVNGTSQTITTARAFTITYTHGAENRSGDKLLFTAKARPKWVERTVAKEITGMTFTSTKNIPLTGDSRVIKISAVTSTSAPTFQLKRMICVALAGYDSLEMIENATQVGADMCGVCSAPRYYDGEKWTLTPTTLTWAASADSSYMEIQQKYSGSIDTKKYIYEIIPIDPGSLSDNFTGENPISLYQWGEATLTNKAQDTPAVLYGTDAAAVPNTRILAYDDGGSSLSSTTASNKTISGPGLTVPSEDANTISVSHKVVSRDVSVGTTEAIDVVRDPTAGDFEFLQTTGVVKTQVDNSTSVTMLDDVPSLGVGMVVTDEGEEGIIVPRDGEERVTIASISGPENDSGVANQIKDFVITLSSAQNIPAGTVLQFDPPNNWEFSVSNITLTKGSVITAAGANHAGGTDAGGAASPINPLYQDVTVTADLTVEKFGVQDITVKLNTAKFLAHYDVCTPARGISATKKIALATPNVNSNITGYGEFTGDDIVYGTPGDTTLNGTLVVRGDWAGNTAEDITIKPRSGGLVHFDISSWVGDNDVVDTPLTFTTDMFEGEGTGDDEAKIDWKIDLSPVHGSPFSSKYTPTLDFEITLANPRKHNP